MLRADWLAPMSGSPIADGGVVIEYGSSHDTADIGLQDGRIIAVGTAPLLRAQYIDAKVIDRPGSIILPGLVNAHTHLELSEVSCGAAPSSFVEWVMRLVPRGQATADSVRESVIRSIPIGVTQCLRSGVTCVGDISRHCAVTRPLLRSGPLRVVSYGEVQAMARRRELLDERIELAIDSDCASPRLRIGITPHAPYSVETEGYRKCLETAIERHLPIATHLAETPHEAPFLATHEGPLRAIWDLLHAWDEDVPKFAGGPIRFAQAVGLLDHPTLLAHVNYCDDAELELLSRGKASVVYCPRTHAYFRHPPHRWREMLARGINVAVGTDSCASSPDLNLLEELRYVRRLAPGMAPLELWQMATVRAARAIEMEHLVGSITPGRAADLAIFPCQTDDPLTELLESHVRPAEVWIDGHPLTSVADSARPM